VSRYEIDARSARHKVIVGWDRPMATFFGQVIDRRKEGGPDEDNKMILWVGTRHGELIEIEQLARRIAPFAALPETARNLLRADQGARPGSDALLCVGGPLAGKVRTLPANIKYLNVPTPNGMFTYSRRTMRFPGPADQMECLACEEETDEIVLLELTQRHAEAVTR
jgi:hypothetical protein